VSQGSFLSSEIDSLSLPLVLLYDRCGGNDAGKPFMIFLSSLLLRFLFHRFFGGTSVSPALPPPQLEVVLLRTFVPQLTGENSFSSASFLGRPYAPLLMSRFPKSLRFFLSNMMDAHRKVLQVEYSRSPKLGEIPPKAKFPPGSGRSGPPSSFLVRRPIRFLNPQVAVLERSMVLRQALCIERNPPPVSILPPFYTVR